MKRNLWVCISCVAMVVLVLLTGCGSTVPSSSFDESVTDTTAEEWAESAVESHGKSNREAAKKSSEKAKEKMEEGISSGYDTVVEEADEIASGGISSIAEKILYNIYLLYYSLVEFAIPIICVGWGLALLFYLIFRTLPKMRKFGIMFFGVGVTGVVLLVLFLPSVITSLGK